MSATLLILLTSLVLHVLAFGIVIRHLRARRADMTTRRPAAPHWHRRFSAQPQRRDRGESILEALLVILFCGAVAAALTICLSDEEDLVARSRDVRPTGEARP